MVEIPPYEWREGPWTPEPRILKAELTANKHTTTKTKLIIDDIFVD